jgi:cytochrome c peroxidase
MKRYLCFIALCAVAVILHTSFTGDTPTTKAELGKLLFFDPILSKDRTISCAPAISQNLLLQTLEW